jgi:choline-sulfatase
MRRVAGEYTPTIINYWEKSKHFGVLRRASGQIYESLEKSGPGNSSVIAYDRYVTDRAVSFLNTYEGDKPLFLTVGFFGPHCPYVCPPDLFDYYHDRVSLPDLPVDFKDHVHPAVQRWYANRGVEAVPPALVRRARAAYYGLVELLDGYVAEIRAAIQRRLGEENVLLIYLSDHGDMVGDKGLWWKSNFYEGAARVPFIAHGPGIVSPGSAPPDLITLADLGPTLIDLVSGPPLPEQAGTSLVRSLRGDASLSDDRAVFSMLADLKGDAPSAMIRQGPWKLIRHHGYEAPQLFNVVEDPQELIDLGRARGAADLRASLEAQLTEVWDGEAAAHNVELSRQHQAIFHDFAATTGIRDRDQWYPKPGTDCLLDA